MKCFICGSTVIAGSVVGGKYYCQKHIPPTPLEYEESVEHTQKSRDQRPPIHDVYELPIVGSNFTFLEEMTQRPQVVEVMGVQPDGGKRVPVDFRYDLLHPEFLDRMAMMAHYGSQTHDAAPDQPWGQLNYQMHRLVGEKSPVNHMYHHMSEYCKGKPYDKFGKEQSWHLVAIAYNAMMEFFHRHEEEDAASQK